jgi:hypothetical protein
MEERPFLATTLVGNLAMTDFFIATHLPWRERGCGEVLHSHARGNTRNSTEFFSFRVFLCDSVDNLTLK